MDRRTVKEKQCILDQWDMIKKCKIIGISMFGNYFAANGCEEVSLYKKNNSLMTIIKRIDTRLHFLPKTYWINKRLYQSCKECDDVVIVFDFFNTNYSLFHTILKEVRAKRKIIYLWNTINAPLKDIPEDWEIWTFDIGNAERFGYKYGGTFYPIEESCVGQDANQIKFDVFFAGLDKGRRQIIELLECEFDNLGITYRMDLMSRKITQLLFDRYVMYKPYWKIIRCIKSSKAILDITKEGQKGLTLRVVESLCFRKKLITNNSDIVKYKFYNPSNVFVLGTDDLSKLPSFLCKPYVPVDFDIKEYSISRWLDRIMNNEQFYYEQSCL